MGENPSAAGGRTRAEGRRRRARRAVAAATAIGLAVGAGALGWWAARQFESPAQRAAQAAAPTALPVFAEVQRGVLSQEITANAQVENARERVVSVPLPQDATVAVVSRAAIEDGRLRAGRPAVVVNGRPVFALSGSFRLWRDLAPGMSGEDVRQVQIGLRQAGYAIADAELGTFGPSTEAGVRAMYRTTGFSVATGPPASDSSGGSSEGASPAPAPSSTGGASLRLPMDEVVIVRGGLPATVASQPRVGTVLTEDNAEIRLVSGAPVASAELPATIAARVRSGTKGTLRLQGRQPVNVTVASVSAGDADAGQSPRAVLRAARGSAIPRGWIGSSGLATLTLTSVGKATCIVPTRAVAVSSDGGKRILKRTGDGALASVPVRELGTLAGLSAIEPLVEGAVREGDRVRVG